MEKRLTIGDLAKATGTKVETVRYYERVGLLPAPIRTATGNYRAYTAEQLGRLSFIRRSRDLGFTLEQIRALLDLADRKEQSCEAVDAIAREHLAEVTRKLADLGALQRELKALIGQCVSGGENPHINGDIWWSSDTIRGRSGRPSALRVPSCSRPSRTSRYAVA
jgi:DNA-binding transcriptional MerR regulator